ncbi:MAG: YitT family protein [Clostridia bacterium]|nr:YitT family protein [Clostridia bacterium]
MNESRKKKILDNIKKFKLRNFLMLTVAGLVNSIGVTMFLNPVKLYDSGISGTSMLLAQVTPEYLTLSVFLLILNIPLFIYGLKKQGVHFTVYAIYTVAMYSLFAWLITDVLPIDVNLASPLAGKDLLLCSLFGGMISGIGSGLAIRFGGAMDGIEVMAVVFAKKIGITVGTFVMVYNVILYVVCGIIIKSWTLPLYSIIAYAAALKTVDFIVEGFDRSKCAMIVTTMPEDICYILSEVFETGSTKIEVRGGYSNKSKTMVYFIVNRFQVAKLKEIVHEVDPHAYITISEVADVFTSELQNKKD